MGIKGQDRETANILYNCVRYAEVALKVLGLIAKKSRDPNYGVDAQLSEIYLCLLTLVRYAQEEHYVLIVQGSFEKQTYRNYRNFSGVGNIPEKYLQRVEVAANLTVAQQKEQQGQAKLQRFGGFNNRFQSSRGQNRGNRGGGQYNSDYNQVPGFNPRAIATDNGQSD